jgi:hypothetical protein
MLTQITFVMNSRELAETLRPLSAECSKKRIEYMYIKKVMTTVHQLENVMRRPLTLIPYEAFGHLLEPGFTFETKVPGDPYVEQRFSLAEVSDRVLVVGALGEVYHAKLDAKFIKKKNKSLETKFSARYIPIPEVRRFIEIDRSVFNMLPRDKVNAKVARVPTSWGAIHSCMVGDFLIVDDVGVYRVQRDVFIKTYHGV